MHQPVQRKVVTLEALLSALRAPRAAGRTVVHCHGCFDIVHPGHIRYLQFARELGDILVVSLTGDAKIAKGPDRPYIPEELRAENVAALEFVDWVVIDPHATACDLLARLRPDIYVKGREYAQATDPRFQRERQIVEGYGGRVAFHSGEVVFSSTRLLESMRDDQQLDEQRLQTLCQRAGITVDVVRRAIARCAGLRVVVIGDLLREQYVFCDAGAADDAPVLAAQRLGGAAYWGGAAAVALQLRALGAVPTLIAAVGRDVARPRVSEELGDFGVTCRLLPERPGLIERTTFIADDAKLFKLTDGSSAPLDSAAEKRAAAVLGECLTGADVLLWCDHGFGMVSPGLLATGMIAACQGRLFVAGYAAGQRGQLLGLTGAHLLTATERQVREALHDMASGLPAVVSNLLNLTHGQTALVSLRKRGVLGFDAGGDRTGHAAGESSAWRERLRSEFVPTFARHAVDLLGAEEAVLAAAALVLAGGGTLSLATYIAAAAESLAVSYSGGNPPNAAALLALLERRPELQVGGHCVPDRRPHTPVEEPPVCVPRD
ncbi:MAG TPA: adenylyltransferase/cytidyltransferase family protein [Phycisphaerae bacterium]|nr:adenylyltransferase/cytidyltransferase family protein [Phycisphaerae bacterium]HPM24414.1 adenylyltransferase/cytidyltransferase family protein [Phycisphaerae bacterium]